MTVAARILDQLASLPETLWVWYSEEHDRFLLRTTEEPEDLDLVFAVAEEDRALSMRLPVHAQSFHAMEITWPELHRFMSAEPRTKRPGWAPGVGLFAALDSDPIGMRFWS